MSYIESKIFNFSFANESTMNKNYLGKNIPKSENNVSYFDDNIGIFYFQINKPSGVSINDFKKDFFGYDDYSSNGIGNIIKISSITGINNNQIIPGNGRYISYNNYDNEVKSRIQNFVNNSNKKLIIPIIKSTTNETETEGALNLNINSNSLKEEFRNDMINLINEIWGTNGILPTSTPPGNNADSKIFIPPYEFLNSSKIEFKVYDLINNTVSQSSTAQISNQTTIDLNFGYNDNFIFPVFFPVYNENNTIFGENQTPNNPQAGNPLTNGFIFKIDPNAPNYDIRKDFISQNDIIGTNLVTYCYDYLVTKKICNPPPPRIEQYCVRVRRQVLQRSGTLVNGKCSII